MLLMSEPINMGGKLGDKLIAERDAGILQDRDNYAS